MLKQASELLPHLAGHPQETVSDALLFRVVRVYKRGPDEVLACAANLKMARGAYAVAAQMYPRDEIQLRQCARIVDSSKP
jgi:hypothetical protein